ncbi:MAG: tetratricopeptide repeat protein [Bacteroidota bacterium]
MKVPAILITILPFFLSHPIFAQSTVEDYVKEGIRYHDNGAFDQAIDTYQKALELDPKSPLVNYEISMSYFSKGDYEKAIEHADIVLKQKDDLMMQAYLIKGSALDNLGEVRESVKLFEKAIKKTGEHYLLFYNLGLVHYKLSDWEAAEENILNAIDLNSNHPSSHLILANIHNQRGNKVQTLLASHFFLLLEPNSSRSLEVYQMLQTHFISNVARDADKPKEINIFLPAGGSEEFAAVELMISMLEASKSLEDNEGKTEDEMFVENTASFFKMMGEMKKKKSTGIWWTLYTPLFDDIARSGHIETYCKYISQSGNENSQQWLEENETRLDEFADWLKND